MKQFNKTETIKGLNAEVSLSEKAPSTNFTRFLLGTYLDPMHGWMLVQAPFDPVSKLVGPVAMERAAGDREIMVERLKVKTINLGLTSADPITQEKKEEIY